MTSPVPIAIIGSGIFIKEQHFPAVLATPLLTVKVIYSRSLKSAKDVSTLIPEHHPKVELYSEDSGAGKSYKDLLARHDIAGVLIAIPIKNQPEYIEAALKAGKHVFAEKPVGPDVASAKKLIEWYHDIQQENNVTWAVAEQFRFMPKFVYAAEEVKKLGKIIGFHFKQFALVQQDNKYFLTEWRKDPTHNYGFILDGGVHSTAAFRMLLGEDIPTRVTGFSSLAQKHLVPVDTLSAAVKLKSGAVGSFNISFGSTLKGGELSVACEKGSVSIVGDTVSILHVDGQKDSRDFTPKTLTGALAGVQESVLAEVQAWGAALAEGKVNPLQTPEITLGDLELLEYMLRSGDEDGVIKTLELQA